MKKTILSLLLLVGAMASSNAQQKSCCAIASSSQEFAMLSSDPSFVSSHQDPLPFTFVSEAGMDIQYDVLDGNKAHAYYIEAKKPTNNYLFVIHEWWGLNDYIKQEAVRLQSEIGNVNVIALDLYDNKVATNKEDAATYMKDVNSIRAEAIIKGAIAFAGKKAKITTIGWCFGGGWSLQASLLAGKQAKGCIMYYGMPETDLKKLSVLKTDVLGIFAKQDKWINDKVVAQFEADMKKDGKKLTVKTFDADHAFANPSNPVYNKEYAEQAHTMSLAFLKARLK